MTSKVSQFSTPKLTPDTAETVDRFPGSAHQRLAETLVNVILREPGGRAIGLEGPWGSGKSTVIEIARKKLHERDTTKKHPVFLFDAWAHQGDPMRRSFLEELIGYLSSPEVGCLRAADWKEDIERLRSRLKRTTESEIPHLSASGKIVAVVLVLLPLCYLWLSPLLFGAIATSALSVTLPYIEMTFNPLWIGPAIAAAVPVGAFGTLLFQLIRSKVDGTTAHRPDPFNLLFYKTEKKVTDQLIRDEEPTTIELNAIFDRVIASASKTTEKIVIVIDNLDRLPANVLRETWATMRNFFASSPDSPRAAVLRRVWLVVPFDRDHIEHVFQDEGGQLGHSFSWLH